MKATTKARMFAKVLVTRTLEFQVERMPFRLDNVSSAKILAMVRSEINCARSKPRAPWYPSRLMIEPSAACTLRCPLCPSGKGVMTRPRTNMPLETYQAIMDEVGGHAVYAQLWMYGEPFCNPSLPDMIEYSRKKNVATAVSTNGQHVQTKEEAERLVASGLDCLIVALDGISQEALEKYRVGAELRKILRCLELIKQAKKDLGSAKPFINVRTVVMKQNEHDLPEIENLARQYGANMVSRKTAFMSDNWGPEADQCFAPDNPKYQRFVYNDAQKVRERVKRFRCRRPFDRLSVTSEGIVLPCEYDFNQSVPWADCGKGGSFMDAWTGARAKAFRAQFLADADTYPFCAKCSCGWIGPKETTTREAIRVSA